MKTHSIIALSLIGTLAAAQPNSYFYKRKVNATDKEGFYKIPVSPEVAARCKSGLNDLRLYNFTETDTTEIPYLINYEGDKAVQASINFELINDVTNRKCCSFVTLKMNRKEVINRIALDVEESNFDKIIVLEGSNDNKEWFTIRRHLRIVGIQNGAVDFKTTELDFQNAEYSYFRLSFDDDSSNKIAITNAYVYENKVTAGHYQKLGIAAQHQTENKKEKTSEVIVDLPMNFPISYLKLKSKTGSDFYRNFNVYRSTGTFHTPKGNEEAWQIVNSGVIISGEENRIELGGAQTKKIKIEIINYDDQSIELDQVEAYYASISLTTKLPVSETTYLCYGKESDPAPVYDLVHFQDKIPAELKMLNYGNEEIQTAEATVMATGGPLLKNKAWLWGIMSIVILVIGYFALSMLKKEKGSE